MGKHVLHDTDFVITSKSKNYWKERSNHSSCSSCKNEVLNSLRQRPSLRTWSTALISSDKMCAGIPTETAHQAFQEECWNLPDGHPTNHQSCAWRVCRRLDREGANPLRVERPAAPHPGVRTPALCPPSPPSCTLQLTLHLSSITMVPSCQPNSLTKSSLVLGTGKLGGILLRAYLKQGLFAPKLRRRHRSPRRESRHTHQRTRRLRFHR